MSVQIAGQSFETNPLVYIKDIVERRREAQFQAKQLLRRNRSLLFLLLNKDIASTPYYQGNIPILNTTDRSNEADRFLDELGENCHVFSFTDERPAHFVAQSPWENKFRPVGEVLYVQDKPIEEGPQGEFDGWVYGVSLGAERDRQLGVLIAPRFFEFIPTFRQSQTA